MPERIATRALHAITGRRITGACTCISPITDEDIGAVVYGAHEDDDSPTCWRCHRPILSEDD